MLETQFRISIVPGRRVPLLMKLGQQIRYSLMPLFIPMTVCRNEMPGIEVVLSCDEADSQRRADFGDFTVRLVEVERFRISQLRYSLFPAIQAQLIYDGYCSDRQRGAGVRTDTSRENPSPSAWT